MPTAVTHVELVAAETMTVATWNVVTMTDHGVPSGAAGVIFRVVNTNAADDQIIGFQRGDSTDDRTKEVRRGSQFEFWVGMDSSDQTELYPETTDIKFYLTGYFTSSEAYFNQNAEAHALSTGGVPETKTVTSQGGDTAIAAAIEINSASQSNTWGAQHPSSTDDFEGVFYRKGFLATALNGSEQYELLGSTTGNVYVIGYLKGSDWAWSTDADTQSTTNDGTYRNLSAQSGKTWAVYKAETTVSGGTQVEVRNPDDTHDYYYAPYETAGLCDIIISSELNASGVAEYKIEDSNLSLHLLGVFTGGGTSASLLLANSNNSGGF